MNEESFPKQVVYLVGAGASHACVKRVGSPHGILMSDLGEPLRIKLQELFNNSYSEDESLNNLVNSVIDETTDFEHLVTFLDDAPSLLHRRFADDMRKAFRDVLGTRLNRIREESESAPIELYTVLLDLYNVRDFPEIIQGIITTNYDEYIEEAIEKICEGPVDFGIQVGLSQEITKGPRLIKLHGSFGWQDTWPISRGDNSDSTLWIPPGIQKSKQAYPFNVLWGLAREMLSCDILRIIGCRLAANDWDLISLLFAISHINFHRRPQIEVIDSPLHVKDIEEAYPYLEVNSILEVEPIGSQLIAELTGDSPRKFTQLSLDDQKTVVSIAGRSRNWFELWLTQMVEYIATEHDDISTETRTVEKFLGL